MPFALCEVSQKHGSSPVTFGFVYYYSLEDARTAVQTLHGAVECTHANDYVIPTPTPLFPPGRGPNDKR